MEISLKGLKWGHGSGNFYMLQPLEQLPGVADAAVLGDHSLRTVAVDDYSEGQD